MSGARASCGSYSYWSRTGLIPVLFFPKAFHDPVRLVYQVTSTPPLSASLTVTLNEGVGSIEVAWFAGFGL